MNLSLVPRVFCISPFRYRHFVNNGAEDWNEANDAGLVLYRYCDCLTATCVKKLYVPIPLFEGGPLSVSRFDVSSVMSPLNMFVAVRGLLASTLRPKGLELKTWVRLGGPFEPVFGGAMFA